MDKELLKKVGNTAQLCGIREFTFDGGKAGGIKAAEVNNGRLRFTLLKDRALDIADLSFDGLNYSFISKNGITRDEYGFGNLFNGGFLYTCGIDNIGAQEGLMTHGRLHFIPAEDICVSSEKLSVSGIMRDTALFKQNIEIKRKIETAYNSDTLTITDTLTNKGYTDSRYVLMYHFNLGYPLLDEGVRIEADIKDTEPVTEFAKEGVKDALTMCAPQDGIEERVYYQTVNKGKVSVINDKLKRSVKFEFDEKMLPYFIEWKSMISGDYALGIEPSTSKLWDKRKYSTLKAGETAEFKIIVRFS